MAVELDPKRWPNIAAALKNTHAPIQRKPCIQEVIEGSEARIGYQVGVQAPEIQEILDELANERDKRSKQLIDKSNKIISKGFADAHQAMSMGTRYMDSFDKLIAQESRQNRRSKPGWGRGGWQTKEQFTKSWKVKNAFRKMVNQALTEAEIKDSSSN